MRRRGMLLRRFFCALREKDRDARSRPPAPPITRDFFAVLFECIKLPLDTFLTKRYNEYVLDHMRRIPFARKRHADEELFSENAVFSVCCACRLLLRRMQHGGRCGDRGEPSGVFSGGRWAFLQRDAEGMLSCGFSGAGAAASGDRGLPWGSRSCIERRGRTMGFWGVVGAIIVAVLILSVG